MKNNDVLLYRYEKYLLSCGREFRTIQATVRILRHFERLYPCQLKFPKFDDIIDFIGDKKLRPATLHGRYSVLRVFYRWCEEEDIILINPMLKVPAPKLPRLLPKLVMTESETQKMLEAIPADPSNPILFRNRLILELLYSCSLRRGELVALNLSDYDFSTRSLRIIGRTTKTNTGRIVPVGRIAAELLERYIGDIRPKVQNNAIFLNRRNRRMGCWDISNLVADTRKRVKIKTKATSHSFRKSSATHMLRRKAPLISVSRLLGHTDIAATQLYTKVYPADIIKMHRAHHPREKQKNITLPELNVPRFLFSHSSFELTGSDLLKIHAAHHSREKDDLPELKIPEWIDSTLKRHGHRRF